MPMRMYIGEGFTEVAFGQSGKSRHDHACPQALKRSRADIAFGVTGFAGPAGEGREEGLVHMALARRGGGGTKHREEHFGAVGRGEVRVRSLKAMLEMLEQALSEE